MFVLHPVQRSVTKATAFYLAPLGTTTVGIGRYTGLANSSACATIMAATRANAIAFGIGVCHIFGGVTTGSTLLTSGATFDGETYSSYFLSLPAGRHMSANSVVSSIGYIFGGSTSATGGAANASTAIFKLTPGVSLTTESSALSQVKSQLAAGVLSSASYVFGGAVVGVGNTTRIEQYDGTTISTIGAVLTAAGTPQSTSTVSSKIFVGGGNVFDGASITTSGYFGAAKMATMDGRSHYAISGVMRNFDGSTEVTTSHTSTFADTNGGWTTPAVISATSLV